MNYSRVAFPSTIKGISGELSFHFGHALAFTIVEYDIQTKKVIQVEVVRNVAHQHGACMRPIKLLLNSNINEVVIGGIGRKPLQGFHQVSIDVYQGINGTVKENLNLFLNGKLPAFKNDGGCKQGDTE